MRLFILLSGLTALLWVPLVHAGTMFRPAVYYSNSSAETGSGKTTVTRRLIDLNAGYVWPSGLTAVVLYGMETRNTDSGSSTSTDDRKSLGAGVGWQAQAFGPYLSAVYIFDNQLSSGGTKYTGTGMQFDLGYKVMVGGVGLGLQMTYRQFTYNKVSGSSLSPEHKYTSLDPMFAFVFGF